jgi:hypothetical protein
MCRGVGTEADVVPARAGNMFSQYGIALTSLGLTPAYPIFESMVAAVK